MCKNKHLTYKERQMIEFGINNNEPFKIIAEQIGKDPTTISKEIRTHLVFENTGCYGRVFNNCKFRKTCTLQNSHKKCGKINCPTFEEEICSLLFKAPYVCNGCKHKNICTLTKRYYRAATADEEYRNNLSEFRQCISLNDNEIQFLNNLLYDSIVNKKQSIHHVYASNKNIMPCSERNIYRLIDKNLLKVKNIDLQRKVRRKIRTCKVHHKIDKNCTIGRKYLNFQQYLIDNPNTKYVEIDTVEGVKGGKVLLTITFKQSNFMLAYIRDNNDAQSVIDIFKNLKQKLGKDKFKELFPVILADNGTEFSNPSEIEIDESTGEILTKIYYCDPASPGQKGTCEVTHELIRYFIPKGQSLDDLTQVAVNLMMSNINSYKRKKLNDRSAYELFSFIYGQDIALKLDINYIDPNNVIMCKKIFNK